MKYQTIPQRDDVETGIPNKIMDGMGRDISHLISDITSLTSTVIRVVIVGLFGLMVLVAIGVTTGILSVFFYQQSAQINALQAKESNSSAQINALQAYKSNSNQTIQLILGLIDIFNVSSTEDIIRDSQTILNLTNLAQALNGRIGDLLLNITAIESIDSNQNTRLSNLEWNITQITSVDSNQNIRLNNLESNMTQILGVINLLNVSSAEDIIRDSQTILNLTDLAQTLNGRMNDLSLNITAIESTDSNQNTRLDNLESTVAQTDSDQNTRLNNLESNMTQILGVINLLNMSSAEDIIRDSQTILNLTDLAQMLNGRVDILSLNITTINNMDTYQNGRLDLLNDTIQSVIGLVENITSLTQSDSNQNVEISSITATIQDIQFQIVNLLGNISSLNQSVDISSLQAMVRMLNETITGFATRFTTANLTVGDNLLFTGNNPKIFASSPNGVEVNTYVAIGNGYSITTTDPAGNLELDGIIKIDSGGGTSILTTPDQTNIPITIRGNLEIEGTTLKFTGNPAYMTSTVAPVITVLKGLYATQDFQVGKDAGFFQNVQVYGNGSFYQDLSVAGTFSNPSDSKFKENIQLVDNYAMLEEVEKFNIYNYTYTKEFANLIKASTSQVYTGFLADQVANTSKVYLTSQGTLPLPSLVDNTTTLTPYTELMTTRMVAVNTGAIKATRNSFIELKSIVKILTTRLQNSGMVGMPDFSDLLTLIDNLR